MIETRRLKNVVVFVQTILSFVLSRKIKDTVYFSFFVFLKELKNELFKKIKINSVIIVTSMVYT